MPHTARANQDMGVPQEVVTSQCIKGTPVGNPDNDKQGGVCKGSKVPKEHPDLPLRGGVRGYPQGIIPDANTAWPL